MLKYSGTEGYRSGHNEAVLKTVCPKGTRVRIPFPPPRRSKVYFAPTYFLSTTENKPLPAPLLLLFRKKSRLACLFGSKHSHNDLLSPPTFCVLQDSWFHCPKTENIFFILLRQSPESIFAPGFFYIVWDTHVSTASFCLPLNFIY